MKFFLSILLLAAIALAQTDRRRPPSPFRWTRRTPAGPRAVLDQTIQALGGPAYLNIQDITQEGRTYSFYHGRPNSLGILFWRFYKFPDKDRIELTKQRDVIYVYNGDKGYEITYKGARPARSQRFDRVSAATPFLPRLGAEKMAVGTGSGIVLRRPTVAEEKTVEQVTVMNAHNEGVTLYVDIDDHLPVKKTFSWRDPTDKQRNIEDEVYDNYREVQGIMTPHTVTRFYNGDMSGPALHDRGQLQPGDQRFPVRAGGASDENPESCEGHIGPESPAQFCKGPGKTRD